MKKVVVVCAAVLTLAGFAAAPAAAAVDFTFGVKGGVSLSNVKWSDDDGGEKTLVRPTFGVLAVINLSPTLAIQPELSYLTMGESWMEGEEYKVVHVFNYLRIPVLIRLKLAQQGKIVPFAFAGPAFGILMSGHERVYLLGSVVDETSAKIFLKSTDFGLDFGAGAEFIVSSLKLFLDFRCCLGLANCYDYSTEYTLKNNALVLAVGALF